MLSRCFNIHFEKKLQGIKYMLKIYVLVLSLITFYGNRTAVVYKVIWYVIYSFIDNFLSLDYLGILQQKLYTLYYDNNFEKQISMICLGWLFLKSWFFKTDNINSNSYTSQYFCAILFVKRIYYCWKLRWVFCKYTRSSSQTNQCFSITWWWQYFGV